MNAPNINTELLAGDARGRKHVPFAVFAVILIHVVLFVILLVAAGCRAKLKSTMNGDPEFPAQAQATAAVASTAVVAEPGAATPAIQNSPDDIVAEAEPAEMAEEPVVAELAMPVRTPAARVYVVRPGDSLGRIAKLHGTTVQSIKAENQLKSDSIRVGQKLRVSGEKPRLRQA